MNDLAKTRLKRERKKERETVRQTGGRTEQMTEREKTDKYIKERQNNYKSD